MPVPEEWLGAETHAPCLPSRSTRDERLPDAQQWEQQQVSLATLRPGLAGGSCWGTLGAGERGAGSALCWPHRPSVGLGGAMLQGLCRGRSHLPVSAGPSVALEGALARSLLSDQTGSTGSFPPPELLMTLP